MALDRQRNWDAAMEDSPRKKKDIPGVISYPQKSLVVRNTSRPFIHLPDEIILLIIDHLATDQSTLAACCYISRQWHGVVLPYLYARPQLYGKGFERFARTVCPSINLHVRRSPLSSLIKELDLGRLVHQSSKSMTARLLGRTKTSLELFRAPQASFAINCLPALSKCILLRHLDLSLVSESPSLPDLLKAIYPLNNLTVLKLPRSTGYGSTSSKAVRWPSNLKSLALSGGVDNHILRGEFPQTLTDLIIEHCPHMSSAVLTWFLAEFIRPLAHFESIRIAHMPRFDDRAMDDVLYLLPQVKRVSVSVDYITQDFFSGGNTDLWSSIIGKLTTPDEVPAIPFSHENLQVLELTSRGSPDPVGKIGPIDILDALDDENLPALRVVQVPNNIQWQQLAEDDADALTAELQALNQADYEQRAGMFKGMSEQELRRVDPDHMSGLWIYEQT